ncbi:MAG: hypothetical protein HXY20_03315 [Acidobacteria bacterium]|nr:hypothetical protein [Acidobacteriota bacterium]
MNRLMLLVSALLAFSLVLGGAVVAVGKPTDKTQKLTAEIVSVDPMAKTITIKVANGESKTATAVDKAAIYIRSLKPGNKAILTCRQDEKGEIKDITKFKVLKK